MQNGKIWGVVILAAGFAAAAGVLEHQNRQSRPHRLPPPDLANGPRSEQGHALEKWLKYVTTYFGREDLSIFEENGRPEILQEKAELDTRGLTRADRHIAQRLIDRLHEICEQKNFHLDILGLNRGRGEVVVEVDPARPYRGYGSPGLRQSYTGAPAP